MREQNEQNKKRMNQTCRSYGQLWYKFFSNFLLFKTCRTITNVTKKVFIQIVSYCCEFIQNPWKNTQFFANIPILHTFQFFLCIKIFSLFKWCVTDEPHFIFIYTDIQICILCALAFLENCIVFQYKLWTCLEHDQLQREKW